jgi:integrase
MARAPHECRGRRSVGRRYRDKRLYDRGGRFIWARVRDEKGYVQRVSTGCTDETAASDFADDWERRAANPSYRRSAEATVGGAIADWFAQLQRKQVRPATMLIAQQKAGHFVRVWGADWPLLRVTSDLVLEYIDRRQREGVKPLTIKKELGALKGILEWALFRGTFRADLITVIPPYSGQHKPRTRAPTREEVVAILEQLEPDRAAHVAFFAACGARRGEAERAQREDIDLSGERVLVRGSKTERAADHVPITGLTYPLVVFVLQHAVGRVGEPLFAPWGNLSRDLKAACVRAGVDDVTPNDLRRAFGTWHRKAGMSAEDVSLLLRHTTDKLAQTTYAKVTAMDVAERARKAVPILYAAAAETAESGVNQMTDLSPDSANTLENAEPLSRFELETYGLRNLYSSSARERLILGSRLGRERTKKASGVPELYAGGSLDFRRRAAAWFARGAA